MTEINLRSWELFVVWHSVVGEEMKPGSAAKLNVDALLQRFLPLARRCIETAQVQSVASFFSHVMSAIGGNTAGPELLTQVMNMNMQMMMPAKMIR